MAQQAQSTSTHNRTRPPGYFQVKPLAYYEVSSLRRSPQPLTRNPIFTLVWVLLMLVLAGCDSGAVRFAPTPLPPDLSPLAYQHPSQVFTLQVPRDWAVYSQNLPTLASTSFAPPNASEPVLTVAVVSLSEPLDTTRFAQLLDEYQTLHRPDINRYTEQDRQAMGDGSWRFSGVRTLTGGTPQPINTFIEYRGNLVGVLEVVIPQDNLLGAAANVALQTQLQTAINTFTLNLNAEGTLQASELSTLSFVRRSGLDVQNVAAWTNPSGVLFVTGEVVNYTESLLANVPITVQLLAADNSVITEAADMAMGYGISSGGFAPFSLRFGAGQPPNSTAYRVVVGSPNTAAAEHPFISGDTLVWTYDAGFAENGDLRVFGSVRNTGAQAVAEVIGIVTMFDYQQQVIAAWSSPLTAPDAVLANDASLDFEMRIPEIGGEPINYILEIQALPIP